MPSAVQIISQKQFHYTINKKRYLAATVSLMILIIVAVSQAHAQVSVDGKTTGQTIHGYANRAAYTGRRTSRHAKNLAADKSVTTTAQQTASRQSASSKDSTANPNAQSAVYFKPTPNNATTITQNNKSNTNTQQPGATFAVNRYSRQRRPAHHNTRRYNNSRRNNYSYGGYYYGYTPYYSHNYYYRSSGYYSHSYYPYSSHYGYGHSYGYGHHYSGYGSHYRGHSAGYGHGYSGLSISYGSCR